MYGCTFNEEACKKFTKNYKTTEIHKLLHQKIKEMMIQSSCIEIFFDYPIARYPIYWNYKTRSDMENFV